ncbi:MAG: hypothetical protein NTX32_07615 [Candidatus Firestonebacteria bacterium]|nr:hypothetical protein [Candidatus Firestonebacteria bacterium]
MQHKRECNKINGFAARRNGSTLFSMFYKPKYRLFWRIAKEKDKNVMDTLNSFKKYDIIELEEQLFWRRYQILENEK